MGQQLAYVDRGGFRFGPPFNMRKPSRGQVGQSNRLDHKNPPKPIGDFSSFVGNGGQP